MFIVTLTYLRPLKELDALMTEHVAWLRTQYATGLFIASGRQKPRHGGIILACSGSRSKLKQVLAGDPFVSSGCASFDIIEFTPSMTAKGAEVLKTI